MKVKPQGCVLQAGVHFSIQYWELSTPTTEGNVCAEVCMSSGEHVLYVMLMEFWKEKLPGYTTDEPVETIIARCNQHGLVNLMVRPSREGNGFVLVLDIGECISSEGRAFRPCDRCGIPPSRFFSTEADRIPLSS